MSTGNDELISNLYDCQIEIQNIIRDIIQPCCEIELRVGEIVGRWIEFIHTLEESNIWIKLRVYLNRFL